MPAITSILAAAAIAATAGSAISSADSARRARNTATDAANAADPAGPNRGFFRDWVMGNWDGLSSPDPNQILKDPSFQFLKTEGERGVTNQNVADFGSTRNGTYGEDMSKFNQGLASTFIDKQFQRNMATLGMAGGFGGFTTGSPGTAGQVLLQGNQNATGLQNNFWQQLGGGMQLLKNNFSGGGGWNGTGMSENEMVIGN